MAEEAGKTSRIEKFDGTDFAYWRMQIEDYLYGRKLHLPLLGTKPKSMKAEEWVLLDRQVLGVIRLTLSRFVAHNVVKEKTTTDLMKALSGMYEKPSVNNKVHLMKKLFNLKMVENASVAQHLNEFNTITNQLSSVEIDFDDKIRALIVLASLPNSWEAMRMARADETSGSGSALNLKTRGRGDFGKVYLDDGSALDVVGLGDFRISLPNGSVWLLEKVRHIPDLRRNLIYVGQLDDEGHAILFVGGTWKLLMQVLIQAYGTVRLGHMSEKGMKMLLSKGKLPELKSIDFDMCENCILGKQKKDNGGEYIDGRFSEYCVAQGIRMEKTIPGIQQNGVAKRMNRTLNERARTYLINRGLSVPMEFRLPKEAWSGSEEDKENVNSQVDLSTPVVEVRRSFRNIRPPQHYSPVLNYLLLTNSGEPECYDEALQYENLIKWEFSHEG
ncbi:Retrovirus-related Pol polyprotein from transposon TNT 1-94 [Vitis vinifera]|uniref:Retrovirus-related Pol polyprotein from transposon TNT 1-94 n=1 Tax=Vitis vinifera TaxID=29760 RepID=A0A438HIH6_VITVI|nr:Retrovirus-related Pol polyprotein from transposon TNT 1-94 [Vitis vinifera]